MNDKALQLTDIQLNAQAKLASLVKLSSRPLLGVLASAVFMFALAFLVNMFDVPNPNIALISGLVISAALFSYPGGITAGIIMMAYTLSFFSTNHDFVTFSDQNMQKVVVSAIGVVVVLGFVSALRVVITQAFQEMERLNRLLEEDNKLLEEASAVDSLTGIRNRFGLRRDFTTYLGRDLHVMMLDVDDFKTLNDTFGHQAGDLALKRLGSALAKLFGEEHVYRYGGDEFLAVCPEIDSREFAQRVEELKNRVGEASGSGHGASDEHGRPFRISVGYVHGTPADEADLRLMMRQADGNLYESKDAGKNRVTSGAFSREAAQNVSRWHEVTRA